MLKVISAGIQHETNTFAPTKAGLDAFLTGGSRPPLTTGPDLFPRVKGKNLPIRIYEPLGSSDSISDDLAGEIERHSEALALYKARDFASAQDIFLELQVLNPSPVYDLYLQRINAFRETPPAEDWGGVYEAVSK